MSRRLLLASLLLAGCGARVDDPPEVRTAETWVRPIVVTTPTSAGSVDFALDPSGDILVYASGDGAGFDTSELGEGDRQPGLLARLDPRGNVLWQQRRDARTASLSGATLRVDAAGRIFLAVSAFVGASSDVERSLRSLDADGSDLWSRDLGEQLFDVSGSSAPAFSSLFSGDAVDLGLGPLASRGRDSFYVATLDDEGNVASNFAAQTPEPLDGFEPPYLTAFATFADGGGLVRAFGPEGGPDELIRYAPDGSISWSRLSPEYLLGVVGSGYVGVTETTTRYDAAGEVIWTLEPADLGISDAFDGAALRGVAAAPDDGVLLCGDAYTAGGTRQSPLLVRMDSAGAPSVSSYGRIGAGGVFTRAAIDPTGRAIVTGYAEGTVDLGSAGVVSGGDCEGCSTLFVARIDP